MTPNKDLLNHFKKHRLPTMFCPGCGIGLAVKAMLSAFDELKFTNQNTAVVSGIGCAARTPGYLEFDSINAIHGRALPIAQGLKVAQPDVNVVVISGDGDLLGIGGNHLLHAVRRGMNITTILINNYIYGLTGGQTSPASPIGTVSATTPEGSTDRPVNVQKIITAYPNSFFGRSTCFHIDHLQKVIQQALQWPSFSFVEVVSPCPTNYFKKLGYKKPADIYQYLKKEFKLVRNPEKELDSKELGIITT